MSLSVVHHYRENGSAASSLLELDQVRSHLLYSDTGSQSLASGKQNWGIALSLSSASRICLVGRSSCQEEEYEEREMTRTLGLVGVED